MATYARLQNADSIEVNDIRSVAGAATAFSAGLNANVISEITAAAGVTIDGLQIKDSFPVLAWSAGGAWVPTISTQANSFSPTLVYARYIKMGTLCMAQIYFSGTQNTGPSNYLTFTLPFTPAALPNDQISQCYIEDTADSGHIVMLPSNATARVYKRDKAVWVQGVTTKYVISNFFFNCV